MTSYILSGKKAICNFMGRGWPVIEKLILEQSFPARKILGVWESDAELITAWRQQQINGAKRTENQIKSTKRPINGAKRTENQIKSTKRPRRLIRVKN